MFGFKLLVEGFNSLELLIDFGVWGVRLDDWGSHVGGIRFCNGRIELREMLNG